MIRGRLALLATAMVLTSCALEKRHRMELVVETRSASGSRHWSGNFEIVRHLGPSGYGGGTWRGEAIPIEVGGGKFVYALPMGSDHRDEYLPLVYGRTFGDRAPGWGRFWGRSEVWPTPPRTGEIFSFAPMIVRFGNDADPSTLEVVRYDAAHREIANGVEIVRIVVKRTTGEPHFDLVKHLPWLQEQMEPARQGPSYKPLTALPNDLYVSNFVRGAPGHVASR